MHDGLTVHRGRVQRRGDAVYLLRWHRLPERAVVRPDDIDLHRHVLAEQLRERLVQAFASSPCIYRLFLARPGQFYQAMPAW